MGIFELDSNYPHLPMRLTAQAYEWALSKFPSPLFTAEDYQAAHLEAKRKTIIPWLGDLTSADDMIRLANALKKYQATVTLMNLSNAMLIGKPHLKNAADHAELLSVLPMTPLAPILISSVVKKYDIDIKDNTQSLIGAGIYDSLGPFFGIENLRNHGGPLTQNTSAGEAALRRYVYDHRAQKLAKEELMKMADSIQSRPANTELPKPRKVNGRTVKKSSRYTPPRNKG